MDSIKLNIFKQTYPTNGCLEGFIIELSTTPCLFSKEYKMNLGESLSQFRDDLYVEFEKLKDLSKDLLSEEGQDRVAGLKELEAFGFFV